MQKLKNSIYSIRRANGVEFRMKRIDKRCLHEGIRSKQSEILDSEIALLQIAIIPSMFSDGPEHSDD